MLEFHEQAAWRVTLQHLEENVLPEANSRRPARTHAASELGLGAGQGEGHTGKKRGSCGRAAACWSIRSPPSSSSPIFSGYSTAGICLATGATWGARPLVRTRDLTTCGGSTARRSSGALGGRHSLGDRGRCGPGEAGQPLSSASCRRAAVRSRVGWTPPVDAETSCPSVGVAPAHIPMLFMASRLRGRVRAAIC